MRNKSRLVEAGLFAAALMSLGIIMIVVFAVSTNPYPEHTSSSSSGASAGRFQGAATLFIGRGKCHHLSARPRATTGPVSAATQKAAGQKVGLLQPARYVIGTARIESVEVSNGIN